METTILPSPEKGEAFAREMVRLGVPFCEKPDLEATYHVEIRNGRQVKVMDNCNVKWNHSFMRDNQYHNYCPECGVDLETVTDED